VEEQRTPTSRWLPNPDGSWTPDRDRGAAAGEAVQQDGDFLEQGDIVAGPGVTVTPNPDGSVTIASLSRGYYPYKWAAPSLPIRAPDTSG